MDIDKKQPMLTVQEVAKTLNVSKLTVYDLIKHGDLPAVRVGRQFRIAQEDLFLWMAGGKGQTKGQHAKNDFSVLNADHPDAYQGSQRWLGVSTLPREQTLPKDRSIFETSSLLENGRRKTYILSGQDVTLDFLARRLSETYKDVHWLRSAESSMRSLVSLLLGEAHLATAHLLDIDGKTYNTPYIHRLLIGHRYIVIHLARRPLGLAVPSGNPKNIQSLQDLSRPDVKMVNREKGSGVRVYLDVYLMQHHMLPWSLRGYYWEVTSHLDVAMLVKRGESDTGLVSAPVARMFDLDFIPLTMETLDVVMLKDAPIRKKRGYDYFAERVLGMIREKWYTENIVSLTDYDFSESGKIVFES